MTEKKFLALVVSVVLSINLCLIGMSYFSLAWSKKQYIESAAITAQNLSQVLEQNISGTINTIEMGIFDLAREVERQLAAGGVDKMTLGNFMVQAQKHMPELDGLRVADADGNIFYPSQPPASPRLNIIDRDYFRILKNDNNAQLLVSKPMKGKVADRWIIVLARRINKPDGGFGGVALGALPLDKIELLFSSINVGKHGAFALRDGTDLGLVARYPEPEGLGSSVGHKKMSSEFTKLLNKGLTVGWYNAPSGLDKRMRTWGYRKFRNNFYYIFVGLAEDEYLADWHKYVSICCIILGLFFLVSIIAGWTAFLRRKQNIALQESLRANDQQMRLFFERQIVGMAISTPDKHWTQMNDKWCQILGYERDELEHMTWEELTYPEDLPENIAKFNLLLAGRTDDYTITKRFIRKDGSLVIADLSVGSVRNEDGSLNCVLSLMEDVTERKQIENELRDAEWKFRALFENGPIGVAYHSMIYDELGKPVDYYFIDANENYLELTGVDPRGKTVTQAFPGIENDPFDWIGVFGHVAKTGESIHFEQYLQSNDRWYDVVGYQYKPDHFVASFVEITDRKRAEETLQESESRWKFALEGSGDGVWDWNIKDGKAYYSPRYKEMLGFSEDEIGNTSDEWLKRIHPDDVTGVMTALKPYLEGKAGSASVEYRMMCKDGSWKSILGRGMVVSCDRDGKPLRMIGTNTDLTERKTAEQELRTLELQMQQAQKLESLGILAGGIAHDFNNILMSIMGNADLALMRINKESPAVENLHKIEQASARAADLAKQMLAYSGKGKFVVENIDLNTLLKEMLHMLEVSISKKAVLRLNPHTPLPAVEADATQIRQIIMNLVINASEAIGEKSGFIAITTGCLDCDRNYLNDVWLNDNISEGLYVYLEIADTGCGMNKETLAKLFDPFFTTKFTGRGLGMAAVLGIVRGHKGAIKVYSEPNRGTSFKILLPASSKPAEIFNETSHHGDWKGEGTVLLIDDEETVRSIGSEMLKELGFTVITADDGREGVAAFRNNPDIIFIIMDLTMPHMDGEQCFRELRRIKPDVRVIMSSGYSEHEVTQKFAGKGLAGFIQKPYKLSLLREAIQKI